MELTGRAVDRILRIQRIKKATGFLRIRAKKRSENRWIFEMGFDTERDGDVKAQTGGVTAVMDKTTWKVLEGAVVDFEESGGRGAFTITQRSSGEPNGVDETKPSDLRGVVYRVLGKFKISR